MLFLFNSGNLLTEKYLVEERINIARNSLSLFCMTECKSQCCMKNKINLTQAEAKFWLKNSTIVENVNSSFTLNLEPKCSQLSCDFKCNLFNKPGRPEICGDFPLFLRGNKIFISSWCLGVKEKQLAKFFEEFERENYVLIFQ